MKAKSLGLVLMLVSFALAALAVFAPGWISGSEPPVALAAGDELTIVWTGDVMLGDAALPSIEQHGYDWPLQQVAPLLNGDAVVANLETPLTDIYDPYVPSKIYAYRSSPEAGQALAEAGVTAVGLANNHAMDQGPTGLADTLASAEEAGLLAFGAGPTQAEAEQPLIIRSDAVTVGIVALGKGYGTAITAGPRRAGTLPLSRGTIQRGYELAKAAGAEVVVGFVHWGENYRTAVTEQQAADAQRFADSGYDLVVGHGPHVHQASKIVGSTPVVYSLGNFVFGTPGRYSPDQPGLGVVLRTTFGPDGLEGMEADCIVTDNERVEYQPRACDGEDKATLLDDLGWDDLQTSLGLR